MDKGYNVTIPWENMNSPFNKMELGELDKHMLKNEVRGQAQWFMPIIPALWEVDVGRLLESWSLGPAWATWKNLSLEKIQKLARHGSVYLWSQVLRRLKEEAEVGISPEPREFKGEVIHDHATALQPG